MKPANLMLSPDPAGPGGGTVKVADFGLAVDAGGQWAARGDSSGSPAYMSPEQVRGAADRLDGRSDLFGLGAVLYELLAGRRPFVAESRTGLLREIVERDPPPVRQLAPHVPPALAAVCEKALAKAPADRFQTAADFAATLRAAVAGEPAFPAVRAAAGNAERKSRRRAAIAAVLAVAAVGACAVLFLPDGAGGGPAADGPQVTVDADGVRVGTATAPAGELTVIATAADGTERPIDAAAVPPRAGETLTVRGTAGAPLYLYLAHFSTDAAGAGSATAIEPPAFADWPAAAQRRTAIEIGGGIVSGDPSTETVFLLGRSAPLPAEAAVGPLLAGYPQPALHRRASATRALTFGGGDAAKSGAPPDAAADRAARWAEANLRPQFPLIRALTFATAVDRANPD